MCCIVIEQKEKERSHTVNERIGDDNFKSETILFNVIFSS
jgi:hypothetical protein